MVKTEQTAKMGAKEEVEVVTLSREEFERLTSSAAAGTPNPAPAVEEGPHLKNKDIAEAKRQQLREAKMTTDDDGMTADMRNLLEDS